jgi:hypothetical protein
MKTLSEIRNSESYKKEMANIKSEKDCIEITWSRVEEIAKEYAFFSWKNGHYPVDTLILALVYHDYIANH